MSLPLKNGGAISAKPSGCAKLRHYASIQRVKSGRRLTNQTVSNHWQLPSHQTAVIAENNISIAKRCKRYSGKIESFAKVGSYCYKTQGVGPGFRRMHDKNK
jgi:hypothetical protein